MNIFSILKDLYYKSSSARFIDYLKMGGVKIGSDCIIRGQRTARIDMTRPS